MGVGYEQCGISTQSRLAQQWETLMTHPAVMPMTLARRCIQITSRPGDVVMDPYAGSGTTLLAAQELGRSWVGIELKPEYVELIERRIAAHDLTAHPPWNFRH